MQPNYNTAVSNFNDKLTTAMDTNQSVRVGPNRAERRKMMKQLGMFGKKYKEASKNIIANAINKASAEKEAAEAA